MKILILKPSSLGDVIQALPVLRLLKTHFPSAEIYWWIDAGLASLLEEDPDLAGIFPFVRRGWGAPRFWNQIWNQVGEMRDHRFDWVIDLQGLARSALISWLANGQYLVGVGDFREGAPGLYDHSVPRPSSTTHAVDWYLSVLKFLQVPVSTNFCWIPPRPVVAAEIDRRWGGAGERWVALVPGARWWNKRWPVEYFSRLVAEIHRQEPATRLAVIGGKEDQALGQAIAAAAPQSCLNLAGQTSLPEMVEWIRRADLVVSNDTGPIHIAAALNKKVVALFGPTSPFRTGPYGHENNVLQTRLWCVPCMKSSCHNPNTLECLRSLSPEMVLEKTQKMNREGPAQRSGN